MSRLTRMAMLLGICTIAAANALVAQGVPDADAATRTAIRALVDRYMQSIDAADPKLAATVWLTTPEASFIHPVGHERGWDQIAEDVYVKLMGQTFVKRTLKNSSDVTIHVYGEAAVAEFDWDFVATLRSNGSAVHTTGRESQVYVKFPDKGWRLVHVHYSGPAVAPPNNGQF